MNILDMHTTKASPVIVIRPIPEAYITCYSRGRSLVFLFVQQPFDLLLGFLSVAQGPVLVSMSLEVESIAAVLSRVAPSTF